MYEIIVFFNQCDITRQVKSLNITAKDDKNAISQYEKFIQSVKDELNKSYYTYMLDTEVIIILYSKIEDAMFPIIIGEYSFEKFYGRKIIGGSGCTYTGVYY